MEDKIKIVDDVAEGTDVVEKISESGNQEETHGEWHEHNHSTHGHHHHSGHKHHHSRHRHRKRSHKAKKNKFFAFLKKHKNRLINILACSACVILLIILATSVDKSQQGSAGAGYTDITQSTVKIETSVYPQKISLVSEAISYFMNPANDSSAFQVYRAFDGYTGHLNTGLPVSFVYRAAGLPSGVEVQTAILEVSENDTYDSPQIYRLDVTGTNCDIYNLKTGTKYYYRVKMLLSDGCEVGTIGSFETEKSPRVMNIEGAVNVRDIGGWQVEGGQTIRQGLLFRGSEIDGAVEKNYCITEKGLQQIVGNLGVRFDMDLRSSYENMGGTDALGKNVTHKYYGAPMYSDVLNESSFGFVKSVFSDLANPDNYPIYLHCTYGRDRTGTLCYLLEALLGVSDEDLYRDYELSAFTDSYVNYAEFNTFVERIRLLDGVTTKDKVEGWILSAGVTPEQIASIREIFLGEQISH